MNLKDIDFDSIKSIGELLNDAPKMMMDKLSAEDQKRFKNVDVTNVKAMELFLEDLKKEQDASRV